MYTEGTICQWYVANFLNEQIDIMGTNSKQQRTTNAATNAHHAGGWHAILDCISYCTLPTFVRPQCVFLCQCTWKLMRCSSQWQWQRECQCDGGWQMHGAGGTPLMRTWAGGGKNGVVRVQVAECRQSGECNALPWHFCVQLQMVFWY